MKRATSGRALTASCTTIVRLPLCRSHLAIDASGFDPDALLPEIPETNASRSGRERVIELAD
jgi:hypothetical protein